MKITEQDRRDIFNGLEESIGPTAANNLMELLSSTPASQLVTRDDMASFGANLRAELKGEMAELRAELKGEMAELRGEMAELRGEIDSKLARAHASTQRLIVAGMAGNAVAVVTALVI